MELGPPGWSVCTVVRRASHIVCQVFALKTLNTINTTQVVKISDLNWLCMRLAATQSVHTLNYAELLALNDLKGVNYIEILPFSYHEQVN